MQPGLHKKITPTISAAYLTSRLPHDPALLSDEKQYQASLARLLDLEADLLLEGHFGILWTKEDVREFIRLYMK